MLQSVVQLPRMLRPSVGLRGSCPLVSLPFYQYRSGRAQANRLYSSDSKDGKGPAGQPPEQAPAAGPDTGSASELQQRLEAELRNGSDISKRLQGLRLGSDAPKPTERAEPAPIPTEKPEEAESKELPKDTTTISTEKSTTSPHERMTAPKTEHPRGPSKETEQAQWANSVISNASDRIQTLRSSIKSGEVHAELSRLSGTVVKNVSLMRAHIQARLTLLSQQINRLTGTDYSAITALRDEIRATEKLVRQKLVQVNEAKGLFDEAHAKQASSQKEVVGLLERKHSWSATDLERYMALIRSEHVNEQAIMTAKEQLVQSETQLEQARIRLEKKERQQYHEEQVWSDTIRRNSTWVTIGLMGFNVLLLLSNVLIIEPWRRRRLAREIKNTLDENLAITLEATREVRDASAAATEAMGELRVAEVLAEAERGVSEEVDQVGQVDGQELVDAGREASLAPGPEPDRIASEAEEGGADAVSVPVDLPADVAAGGPAPEVAADPAPLLAVPLPPAEDSGSPAADAGGESRKYVSAIMQQAWLLPQWVQDRAPERVVDMIENAIWRLFWLADRLFAQDRSRPVRPLDETVLVLGGAVSGVAATALAVLAWGGWRAR